MSTKIYLTNEPSDINPGAGEELLARIGSPGQGLSTGVTNTTASGSNITMTRSAGGVDLIWFTPPLDPVTLTNAVIANFWMSENNMGANVAASISVEVYSGDGTTLIATCLTGDNGVELPVTTRAAQNWVPTFAGNSPSSGQRLRIRVRGNAIGTMGGGFTFDVGFAGVTPAADGDSWVQFNETIVEQTPSFIASLGRRPVPMIQGPDTDRILRLYRDT